MSQNQIKQIVQSLSDALGLDANVTRVNINLNITTKDEDDTNEQDLFD